jgi:hypothetical protein
VPVAHVMSLPTLSLGAWKVRWRWFEMCCEERAQPRF